MPLIDATGRVLGPAPAEHAATDMTQTPLSDLAAQETVVLAFESWADGRPFSWAARLRSRGFSGRLIGIGPIGLDRLAHGFRCGFDALEISGTERAQLDTVHLQPFPASYQPVSGVNHRAIHEHSE